MADSSVLKAKAESKGKGFSFKGMLSFLREWIFKNKFYFLAFAIPVVIMYIAYAIFGLYPFGDKSVLVLDFNGQYVYYFEALRKAFWGDGSIFYNWSRNLSGEFMGIIGYYLASPYTLIVMLLPDSMLLGSLLIMQLAKLGSAAVTFNYYLQKSKGMTPLHSTIFSTLYALMAYGVIQLFDPMWLDGIVMLPLIMLGVEYLVDDGRKLNYIIPLAIMFFAHFYIGYMIGIFTVLYFLFYVIFGSDTPSKRKLEKFLSSLGRMAYCTVIALCCAAIMLLPIYHALQLGKFEFTKPDFSFALQFTPLDFLGQLFVAQYDSVNVQGLPEIYCGVLTVLLLPLFYTNKEIPILKKVGYTLLAAVLFTCMYIRPIDMVWHGFQMPNWLPFRYSFTFSFVLLSMAATTFAKPKGIKLSAIGGSFALLFAFLMITESRKVEHLSTLGTIWLSVGLAAVYGLIILLARKKESMLKTVVPVLLLIVISGELMYNCVDTLKCANKELAYSTRASWYNYIENGKEVTNKLYEYDDSFYRADKTFHRTVNDNAALGLRGISHSSSVMNAKILLFAEAMGYSSSTYYTRYDGGSPLTDSLLGIKYVLGRQPKKSTGSSWPLVNDTYQPIFSYEYQDELDKTQIITAYQNPNALSIGYMADANIQYIQRFGNDNTFNSQNIFLSTISGNTQLDLNSGSITSFNEYYKKLNVDPNSFVLNNVTTSAYGDQTMYTAADDNNDHTVDMFITAESDAPIYMYFKTNNQKSVNLWCSTEQDETGAYINHDFVGAYFEQHDYHVVNLGRYKKGQTFNLRMTVANEYTIVKDFFFYEFDEALFQQSIDTLKAQQWNLTTADDTHLEGTITAKDNQIMLTSIPYEKGWHVKVDGKSVEYKDVSEALIGIPMTAGEHTVEMRFIPAGFIPGVILLIIGILCMIFLFRYDKKNNKMLIKMYKEKAAAKNK